MAGRSAAFDAWIGYYRAYAIGHEDLDADPDIFVLVKNAVPALAEMVAQMRSGTYRPPNAALHRPREVAAYADSSEQESRFPCLRPRNDI